MSLKKRSRPVVRHPQGKFMLDAPVGPDIFALDNPWWENPKLAKILENPKTSYKFIRRCDDIVRRTQNGLPNVKKEKEDLTAAHRQRLLTDRFVYRERRRIRRQRNAANWRALFPASSSSGRASSSQDGQLVYVHPVEPPVSRISRLLQLSFDISKVESVKSGNAWPLGRQLMNLLDNR